MILPLGQPGLLLLPITGTIFRDPAIAFPRVQTDASDVLLCYRFTLLDNKELAPRLAVLTDLLQKSLPDTTHLRSADRWRTSFVTYLSPAQFLPGPSRFPTNACEGMEVDVPPYIAAIGDAVVHFLCDLQDLNTTGGDFHSPMTRDEFVRACCLAAFIWRDTNIIN